MGRGRTSCFLMARWSSVQTIFLVSRPVSSVFCLIPRLFVTIETWLLTQLMASPSVEMPSSRNLLADRGRTHRVPQAGLPIHLDRGYQITPTKERDPQGQDQATARLEWAPPPGEPFPRRQWHRCHQIEGGLRGGVAAPQGGVGVRIGGRGGSLVWGEN